MGSSEDKGMDRPRDSARFSFCQWTLKDMEDAKSLWGDPKVTSNFSSRQSPWDEAEISERVHAEMERYSKHGVQYWRVVEKGTGKFVGAVGLREFSGEFRRFETTDESIIAVAISDEGPVYELGFHITPDFWGKGVATETGSAVCQFAFSIVDTPASRLMGGHRPDNLASGRVLTKLGFKPVGEGLYEPTGLVHPWYELQRREWVTKEGM